MNEENKKYIDRHPELRAIVDDFVAAAISQKPEDLIKFGCFYFNNLRQTGGIGPPPVVIAGPSGVGKGTLIKKLMDSFPSVFGFSVSHTTRPPRPGEEDGVHYNFVTRSDMEEAIDKGEFVEVAKVHTNMYGTSLKAIETVSLFCFVISLYSSYLIACFGSSVVIVYAQVRNKGKVCILDIDIQGVQNIKKSRLDCKYLFIFPPSLPELEKRLRGRGTETPDKILIRLETAKSEIAYGQVPGNFDASIVNGEDLDVSFHQMVDILQGWYPDQDLYIEK
jgi:guanylate kinase